MNGNICNRFHIKNRFIQRKRKDNRRYCIVFYCLQSLFSWSVPLVLLWRCYCINSLSSKGGLRGKDLRGRDKWRKKKTGLNSRYKSSTSNARLICLILVKDDYWQSSQLVSVRFFSSVSDSPITASIETPVYGLTEGRWNTCFLTQFWIPTKFRWNHNQQMKAVSCPFQFFVDWKWDYTKIY